MQGSAAFSDYGYKSNEELILGYGFMLEDNPADFFHVSLGLVAQAEHGKPSVSDSQQGNLMFSHGNAVL